MKYILSQAFPRLLVFFVSFVWFISFSRSILPTHWLREGLSLDYIALGFLFGICGQLLALFFLSKNRTLSSHAIWRIALIFYAIYFIFVSIRIGHVSQFLIASIFAGAASVMFYLYYNIAHFSLSDKDKTASAAALFFNILTLVGLVAPLVAGLVAAENMMLLLLLSLIFAALSFYAIRFAPKFTTTFDFVESVLSIKGTRSPIYIQGFWEAVGLAAIPLFTLTFIKEPLEFGLFSSFLALASVISTWALGHFIDKYKKDMLAVIASIIIQTLLTVLLAFSTTNLIAWSVTLLLMSFSGSLFSSVALASLMNKNKSREIFIPAREILINLGRLSGLSLVYVAFRFTDAPQYVFVILGVMLLLFIPLYLRDAAK